MSGDGETAGGRQPATGNGQWVRQSVLILTACCLLPAVFSLLGCHADPGMPQSWQYFPDMAESPAYKAFESSPVTGDGKVLMAPATGTVPRGFMPFHYGSGEAEAARAGRELENPETATPEALARGRKVFETFCVVCHGPRGDGDGAVVAPGKFPMPPSLTAKHARELPDGQLFHVVTWGGKLMPGYAAQIDARDRWRAIIHVRAMQAENGAGAKR